MKTVSMLNTTKSQEFWSDLVVFGFSFIGTIQINFTGGPEINLKNWEERSAKKYYDGHFYLVE